MPTKKKSGKSAWVDPDDAPRITRDFFDRAEIIKGGKVVQRGRPTLAGGKEAIKLRIDKDIVAAMRRTGGGWMTRANEALRRAFKVPLRKPADRRKAG